MAYVARLLEYFYTTAKADETHELLDDLAKVGVNFLAVTLVPIGPDSTQMTLFPEDSAQLQTISRKTGLALNGPHSAILVQGDDEPGVLAGIHRRLRESDVEVFASNAITDGRGGYGCVIFLRPEHADRAVQALK